MTLICLVCVVMRFAHVVVIYPGEEAFEVTCGYVRTIRTAASGNSFRTQNTTQQIAKHKTMRHTVHPVYRMKSNCLNECTVKFGLG